MATFDPLPAALLDLLRDAASPPQALPDLTAWWPAWQALHATAGESTAGLALRAGAAADRVGWAFAGGYQAALRALWPALWRSESLAALCVTEAQGNRPRDIHTRIVPQPDGSLAVEGAKRWTTLGPGSAVLLVAGAWSPATEQTTQPTTGAGPQRRPSLRVLRIDSAAPGVTLQTMPPTRFVPEVPHASVLLRDVRVPPAALLPGDGYAEYVKPFRTLEDIHVMLAIGAYLLGEARRRRWPPAFAERLVAVLAQLAQLALADARAAATHLVLAGALQTLQALFAEAMGLWPADADEPAAARWRRDAALLQVAGAAREQRAHRAWERLAADPARASDAD